MLKKWRQTWVEARSNRLYSACLRLDGLTPQGVHWRDQYSQSRRFEELIQVIDQKQTGIHLTDLGCGYGAFFNHIANKPWMNKSRYLGLDMNPDMIQACRVNINDKRAEFRQEKQPCLTTDYLVASGTWNFKMHESRAFWWDKIKQDITRAWQLVEQGMAFNLLSIAPTSSLLFWMDAEEIDRFVKKDITSNALVRQIWGLPDVSVLVWK